ncbi:hypothetical protein FXO38_23457 [Capsicum annuum]|nr:hypothetical protein FXO38_23457 [Capsicum annuum]KAF3642313.1 hypothetical protein FXO37_22590 [Capsicum annuum]
MSDIVRVSLFWGGEVLYEGGSVRYSLPAKMVQVFPMTLKYERRVHLFRSKMKVHDAELSILITGRYPISIMGNGHVIFEETQIWNDDSLSAFLRSPEIFCNQMRLAILDMYAKTQSAI